MSNLDTPNKEEKGASQIEHPLANKNLDDLRLLVEATEFVMSDPVLKLYSAREPAHFVYTIEKMLEFSQSRENPLKEDIKVVGGEDEELLDFCQDVQVVMNMDDIAWRKRFGNDDGLYGFIKSRDKRIALEARIDEDYIRECFNAVARYAQDPTELGGMSPQTALINFKNLGIKPVSEQSQKGE